MHKSNSRIPKQSLTLRYYSQRSIDHVSEVFRALFAGLGRPWPLGPVGREQGNQCPVSGQPLSMAEVRVDKDLRIEINEWQLKEALKTTNMATPAGAEDNGGGGVANGDDLYEF